MNSTTRTSLNLIDAFIKTREILLSMHLVYYNGHKLQDILIVCIISIISTFKKLILYFN